MNNLIINGKSYKIISRTSLASGGNQTVEEIEIKPSLVVDNKIYNNVILKSNKHDDSIDYKSIEVFHKLNHLNIPTVKFYFAALLDGKTFLVTENLNKRQDGIIYVSSNYHPINPEITMLIASLNGNSYNDVENDSTSMEFFLSNNKLDKLLNIDEIIYKAEELAIFCNQNNVNFPEDAIFFGVNIKEKKIFDMVIGDFGSVSIDENLDITINREAMKTAIEEFKMHFVKDNEEQ